MPRARAPEEDETSSRKINSLGNEAERRVLGTQSCNKGGSPDTAAPGQDPSCLVFRIQKEVS